MSVILVSSYGSPVYMAFWQEGRVVRGVRWMSDGSTCDENGKYQTLPDVMKHLNKGYNVAYAVEVPDLRVALKYLGKPTDLVETLPEATIDAVIPRA